MNRSGVVALSLVLVVAACTGGDDSTTPTLALITSETAASTTLTFTRIADPDPGEPHTVTLDRAVTWSGGTCLDLHQWQDGEWVFIAYTDFEDAKNGIWGPPERPEICHMVLVGGDILLPADAPPGRYRLCLTGEPDGCIHVQYSRPP